MRPWTRTPGVDDLTAEETQHLVAMLPSFMLFSVVWSVGASCDKAGRAAFDRFFRERVVEGEFSRVTGFLTLTAAQL